jgi:transposase
MRRNFAAESIVRTKFAALDPVLDERSRRRWAGTEALALGYGGVSVVARATDMSRTTVKAGLCDVRDGVEPSDRLRAPGAGRRRLTIQQEGLDKALDCLIEPITRGDPESPLRWTTKSAEKLAAALVGQGLQISSSSVWRLLRAKGYRLQSTKKTLERRHHDDRDSQFTYINGAVSDFHAAGQPVISVDTKKRELVGDFKNGGREWFPRGTPNEALSHDFRSDAEGVAIPYGVYDLGRNEGFINVGVDHDTSAFAVESIRRWWFTLGKAAYPDATKLLIMADCGGSNGYRRRSWKARLQAFADETDLTVLVSHFPPGTSKWNKIEHRLFCFVSKNWRGAKLTDYATIVGLIGSTTTKTGLEVTAMLDDRPYPTGEKISNKEMGELNIKKSTWHGEWNYTISARSS